MTIDELQNLFEQHNCRELAWKGKCHDCRADVTVVAHVEDDGKLTVSGGALYDPVVDAEGARQTFVKCDACHRADPILRKYRPVVNYSRVVGYYAPINLYNPGKKAEFFKRTVFA